MVLACSAPLSTSSIGLSSAERMRERTASLKRTCTPAPQIAHAFADATRTRPRGFSRAAPPSSSGLTCPAAQTGSSAWPTCRSQGTADPTRSPARPTGAVVAHPSRPIAAAACASAHACPAHAAPPSRSPSASWATGCSRSGAKGEYTARTPGACVAASLSIARAGSATAERTAVVEDAVGLSEKADSRLSRLSGGQRRRVDADPR